MMDFSWVGIDNGKDGAVAIISKNTLVIYDSITISEKTSRGYKRRYDIQEMVKILRNLRGDRTMVALERASAFPGQGVSSMFSLGFGFGLWQGILSSLGLPYVLVAARKWQSEFFPPGDTKANSFLVAQKLFPDNVFKTNRGRILTGRCDAALISLWIRRKYYEGKNLKD